RSVDVPVYDLSLVRGVWEGRVKRHSQKEKEEQERRERSRPGQVRDQWQYRIYCKSLGSNERNLLHQHLQRSALPHASAGETQVLTDHQQVEDRAAEEPDRLVFQLDGDSWTDFPPELQWMTYLREWRISRTRIRQLPDYLARFAQLAVLHLPKNAIAELPPEVGGLAALKELNVSYNRLCRVPAELGSCGGLQRLELSGNHLSQLPFQLSSLKQLVHLDIAENRFASIPICALRMSRLRLLDLSNNRLTDLPQDMDSRLEQLVTLFLHKNHLTYLPHCLTNIHTLRMVVVSGDPLACIPTRLCSNPAIKFIRLYENTRKKSNKRRWREPREEVKDSGEKEFLETYISSLKDRETVPYATTKVSIACLL
uniref:Leucine rich repeat containing 2 n=1 Tax=Tetraodon nigroviridis TaxID=99883 RepID=H3DNH0_TETNG